MLYIWVWCVGLLGLATYGNGAYIWGLRTVVLGLEEDLFDVFHYFKYLHIKFIDSIVT